MFIDYPDAYTKPGSTVVLTPNNNGLVHDYQFATIYVKHGTVATATLMVAPAVVILVAPCTNDRRCVAAGTDDVKLYWRLVQLVCSVGTCFNRYSGNV